MRGYRFRPGLVADCGSVQVGTEVAWQVWCCSGEVQ